VAPCGNRRQTDELICSSCLQRQQHAHFSNKLKFLATQASLNFFPHQVHSVSACLLACLFDGLLSPIHVTSVVRRRPGQVHVRLSVRLPFVCLYVCPSLHPSVGLSVCWLTGFTCLSCRWITSRAGASSSRSVRPSVRLSVCLLAHRFHLPVLQVEYIKGWGKFKSANEIEVDLLGGGTRTIKTTNTIIASGSEVLELPGLKIDEEK
jgi:hypothetical protein